MITPFGIYETIVNIRYPLTICIVAIISIVCTSMAVFNRKKGKSIKKLLIVGCVFIALACGCLIAISISERNNDRKMLNTIDEIKNEFSFVEDISYYVYRDPCCSWYVYCKDGTTEQDADLFLTKLQSTITQNKSIVFDSYENRNYGLCDEFEVVFKYNSEKTQFYSAIAKMNSTDFVFSRNNY